ncbi:hypothetical protein EDM53_00815 [Rickettsiales endosymbiont of Peranema trichophorum]|uniref:hypothetical protein n=1 Tax=Rickettsiales endosymbiont of Peranema trichophorum TaxID=2486577 RepID=UPI001023EF61|nr:hypothetical protein [Rickettsiales endosymbiont of Peranema trichophorum]RZI47646.1 hypothetical protein EDM53_00815 [Rickettsiales endosymbiont of Peranema trichophorum]
MNKEEPRVMGISEEVKRQREALGYMLEMLICSKSVLDEVSVMGIGKLCGEEVVVKRNSRKVYCDRQGFERIWECIREVNVEYVRVHEELQGMLKVLMIYEKSEGIKADDVEQIREWLLNEQWRCLEVVGSRIKEVLNIIEEGEKGDWVAVVGFDGATYSQLRTVKDSLESTVSSLRGA